MPSYTASCSTCPGCDKPAPSLGCGKSRTKYDCRYRIRSLSMQAFIRHTPAWIALASLTVLLAACTAPRIEKAQAPSSTCVAAAPSDGLVGNWLSVRRQSGVTGELRTLVSLRADGTMSYDEQLTRPRKAPQGLSETGCWQRDGQALV